MDNYRPNTSDHTNRHLIVFDTHACYEFEIDYGIADTYKIHVFPFTFIGLVTLILRHISTAALNAQCVRAMPSKTRLNGILAVS